MCMHWFMLSTELTHESATNISTQELCHNDCMYNIQLHTYVCTMYVFMMQMSCCIKYQIQDDQETFSLWGRNLKIFKSESNYNCDTLHAICVYVHMYACTCTYYNFTMYICMHVHVRTIILLCTYVCMYMYVL